MEGVGEGGGEIVMITVTGAGEKGLLYSMGTLGDWIGPT